MFHPGTHQFAGWRVGVQSILVLNAGIVDEPGEVP